MTSTEDPLASGVPSPSSTLCDDVDPFERAVFLPHHDERAPILLSALAKSNSSFSMSEPGSPTEEVKVASDVQQRGVDAERDVPASDDDFPEGGWKGWAAVLGCFLALFAIMGLANSWGVFQDYYMTKKYPDVGSSAISWIGSIQLFLQYALAAVVGPLYDRGHFRALVITGSTLSVLATFLTSLCEEFWQTVLTQAILAGIGCGLLFLPCISIISHHFKRRRALAMGFGLLGGSIGGLTQPIFLNDLLEEKGFAYTVRAVGFLMLGCLTLACCLMHPRVHPTAATQPASPTSDAVTPTSTITEKTDESPNSRTEQSFAPAPPNPPRVKLLRRLARLLRSPTYALMCTALFLITFAVYFPCYYLQVFASSHAVSPNIASWTLGIMNGCASLGRVPNLFADHYGPLRFFVLFSALAGTSCFTLLLARTDAGAGIVAATYGILSGASVVLTPAAVISLSDDFHDIGLRLGVAMFCVSIGALTGTPLMGALYDHFGWVVPTVCSGLITLLGSAVAGLALLRRYRSQGTWRV